MLQIFEKIIQPLVRLRSKSPTKPLDYEYDLRMIWMELVVAYVKVIS